MKKAKVSATWGLSLDCVCPGCGGFVDLLHEGNFWDDHELLQPLENHTERANRLEVICPECRHEFEVCCEC